MPAIRDQSFAYATVTAGGTMTIPTPTWEAGDLMFVFVTGDTGTPTVTLSTGIGSWTQLFQRVNTCSLTVFWKYAAAGEAGDITATISVAESYSCCAVVVRDVYQSYSGGSPPVYSQTTSTGTLVALPTITTSANDSIVLAAISGSASAPSVHFVDSVLHDLVKCDGTAEGMGVGWFYKRTAGVTTAYNAGVMTSGAGGKCVIECRAPAGGATVIPPYVSAESSIYLTPSPGIAYDSNTALAATADTNFGTSIAGKTCNDGTVAAAVADIGIDSGSFQSFGGITNAAVANQMSGAETVMAAARYSVGDRNIMTFFRHATPVQNQRLSTVASGRGVWMGMKSGTTAAANWKVWQVHGGDAPLINGYVQPIVISAANTSTIATNSTITNTDVRRYGFWTGGIGALTQQASFGPMWAMDTTVVSGGDANEPIGVAEIVKTAALAKVRLSSLQQGANQLLCLQAIQFGDGGTNPLYVLVNGAAVEFPSQKNLTKKLLNYNGIDNAVGWTFYPGASDTINLSGTAFASASKYHWKIHASASASATYNFTGVVINGAGDVQLRAVTTFTGMSYANCQTITQNSAVITDCSFTDSKIISDTLGDMDNITGCSFTNTGETGHAIEVSGSSSTITFDGNTFTGYGTQWDGNNDPYWGSVVLAMHMEGSDGGTTFTDVTGKSVSVAGNTHTEVDQYKFGSTSAYFDGTGDYLTLADNEDFQFGSGDFTIEGWFYFLTTSVGMYLVSRYISAGSEQRCWAITRAGSTGYVTLAVSSGGGGATAATGSTLVTQDAWHHIAAVRNGTSVKLYVDGTEYASSTFSGGLFEGSVPIAIGSASDGSLPLNGYIDDLRITKGVARYTADFTAPTAAFPDTGGDAGNAAIYVNIASGTTTLNITGGGSTPSYRTAGATVVVQNAVTVTVTVLDAVTLAPIENARVLLEKVSDGADILPPSSLTNSSGVVTTSYAYTGDTAVTGTARRASAAYGTLYKPGAISGTITSAGLDVTILLNSDE